MSLFRRVLFVTTILAVSMALVGLGRWQLRRLHARRASNAILRRAGERPPLALTSAGTSATPIDSGRRVVAQGHFDPAGQIFLRDRVQNDGPGLQVVTPFALDSGGVIWVLRGFVPSPDAVTPPDSVRPPMPGSVVIAGLALAVPVTNDSGAPLHHNGAVTWRRLDRAVLANLRPGSLPVYLQLNGDSTGPGRLPTVPLPELTDGPHLSYALQWFGMALAVLTFGIVILWRDGRALPPHREVP